MSLDNLLCFAAGVGLGVFAHWLHYKFLIIDYKLNALERPSVRSTDAEGREGDPDIEDVKGQIGYING